MKTPYFLLLIALACAGCAYDTTLKPARSSPTPPLPTAFAITGPPAAPWENQSSQFIAVSDSPIRIVSQKPVQRLFIPGAGYSYSCVVCVAAPLNSSWTVQVAPTTNGPWSGRTDWTTHNSETNCVHVPLTQSETNLFFVRVKAK